MSLFVIGAGGHAKVVVASLQDAGWTVDGILDDNSDKWGDRLLGVPILGPISVLHNHSNVRAIIAIGDNRTRKLLASNFPDIQWVTLIHPRAYVHPSVRLGDGTVVFAGAILQPFASVGKHAIVNTGAIVEHDCKIGDFVHVAPGCRLTGGVEIGEGTLVGTGACIIPGVQIGAWVTIGAGSVVVDNIPEGVIAYGVPAQVKRRNP
ncbi:acetyltransferase [Rhodothermus marinus]|uniref:acetyltransferase n=1 Tax=Rhodothermus marinus TaxID=29549 RepID=UPI0012BA474F|nr:acetyltransferase [Rhodothermus marinus]BBM72076.1 hexapeptide transferase [Rhodothermus marinus]